MNENRSRVDEETKKKIAPVSPAVASALLLSAVFAIYAWGYLGSGFALSLAPALAPYGYAIPSMIYFLVGKWQKRKALAENI